MTYYYKVWVATSRYHKPEPLTYKADYKLSPGSVVIVPMTRWQCLAVVETITEKPAFNVKIITSSLDIILPKQLLQLRDWLQVYYPSPSGMITQHFLPSILSQKLPDLSKIKIIKSGKINQPPLTNEQSSALGIIKDSGSYLLHGETGSGKTRIYQEVTKKTLDQGKSVIILTPEISLTAQLYKNFDDIFGGRVILYHSHLTPKEKLLSWLKIVKATKPIIVIGTRSALFSPIEKLGLIVVDEAHEPAYKEEQGTNYHALRVASKLAELHNSTLLIGSATPSVIDYYIAKQKSVPIIRLEQPAVKKLDKANLPIVVDIKDRSLFTKAAHLSNLLIETVEIALKNREQVLLFLNRRGTAHVILCQNCGWQAMCPNCDTPLIYHGDNHTMRCHVCNYHQKAVTICPVCKGTDLVFKSSGTKAIVDEVEKIFPGARVQRFDTDNKKADRFEAHYENINSGNIDILIGTQTLAKGLDLKNLSVVGVITADTSLYIPDFMAQERTYQLITQVIGRTSRGNKHGQAVIQTYNPSNPVLKSALVSDWPTFYKNEIAERSKFLFPPFCYLLKVTIRRKSPETAKASANSLMQLLQEKHLQITISGPAPSFHHKHGNEFEWQLIIKAKRRSELQKVIHLLPATWSYDLDPTNLL
jgi:primosomal protein N' (replication factor Y) (superfamily II helicase)